MTARQPRFVTSRKTGLDPPCYIVREKLATSVQLAIILMFFWAAAAAAHHYMSRGRTGAVTRKQKLIVFTALHIHHRTIGFSVQLFQRSGMIFQEENEGEETIGCKI